MFNRETRWIRRIQQQHHEQSANKLIEKYYKEIFAYTYQKVVDKQLAMDMTQEIFIRVLQSIHRFDAQQASFRTWLYQIAHHHCVDYFRSKAFQQATHTDIVEQIEVEGHDEVFTYVAQHEQLEEIHALIQQLNEQDQQIMIGKLMHDYTFAQLAETLHMPISTVKTNYYKALKQLKQQLEVFEK